MNSSILYKKVYFCGLNLILLLGILANLIVKFVYRIFMHLRCMSCKKENHPAGKLTRRQFLIFFSN